MYILKILVFKNGFIEILIMCLRVIFNLHNIGTYIKLGKCLQITYKILINYID